MLIAFAFYLEHVGPENMPFSAWLESRCAARGTVGAAPSAVEQAGLRSAACCLLLLACTLGQTPRVAWGSSARVGRRERWPGPGSALHVRLARSCLLPRTPK